jgi:hypothetical protein
MRRYSILILLACLLLLPLRKAAAQPAVTVHDLGVEYTYGEKIIFSATFETKSTLQGAYVLFQATGEANTHTELMKINSKGVASYLHFIQQGLIRPFARVDYWYHVVLADGTTYDSQHYSFEYADNRFPWQTLNSADIRVYWVSGDLAFGQAALNAAEAGYQAIQAMLPTPVNRPVEIYIYTTPTDVQDTLNLGGYPWVGGHASPDIGVVLVSIAPGETQSIEMERQIPHELAHVLIYQITGAAYANEPAWLLEGIASLAERYPNANYAQALNLAAENQALMTIPALCGPFPMDASGATLAYAEADSFSRYLREMYGTGALQALLKVYTDGLNCREGAKQVYGKPLDQLELDWRRSTFGESTTTFSMQALLPYLVLLAFMLVIPAWRLLGTGKGGSFDGRKS